MLTMDATASTLTYRSSGDNWTVTLQFSQLRRLTLTKPMSFEKKIGSGLGERARSAIQACTYRLEPAKAGQPPLTGRTAGHVLAKEGFYLFAPVDDDAAVQRVFVPKAAYSAHQFGPVVALAPSGPGIASRADLLAAIEEQQRSVVEPIGHSLLKLRLVTQAQLDRVLADQGAGHLPIGEMLIKARIISRENFQKALAHKMGYPLVDLVRFPIDPAATKLLPLSLAVKARAVPLMLDGTRLIVAIDKPARTVKLRNLQALANLTLVPVIAPRGDIVDMLTIMADDDLWKGVPLSMRFFATTA